MMTEREKALLAIVLGVLKDVRDRAIQISNFLHYAGDGETGVDMNLGVDYEKTERELYEALGVPFENEAAEKFVIYDYLMGYLPKEDLMATLGALTMASSRKKEATL